jgi:hypothetical protein
MVARAKTAEPEATEAEPEPADGAKSATIDDVKRVVHEALAEVFSKSDEPEAEPGTKAEPEPEPDDKPLTERERESRMERLTSLAVASLLSREPAKAEPAKAEPEVAPMQKLKRATRVVWGVKE